MSQATAIAILNGTASMPDNVTVEAVFACAHIIPSIPTPF